jgi:hypothetical protein
VTTSAPNRQGLKPFAFQTLYGTVEEAAEKVSYFVIPNEVRNLSGSKVKRMRDSSARSVPRNDKNLSFSATSETVP